MDEETLIALAGQLRQPNGEYAIQVGEKMNEGNMQINLNTIEALKLADGDNILEIGMGNGFFVKNILSSNSEITYTGCDYSEIMVAEAHRLNLEFVNNKQAQFHLASAYKLPYSNETFNKVFSVNTIYFWDDQQLVFSEIRRVLKSKGQLIISVRPKSLMQNFPFVKYGFEMFSKDELADLLSKNNFKVIEIIEKIEPEQEMNGQKMKGETLIVCAEKL